MKFEKKLITTDTGTSTITGNKGGQLQPRLQGLVLPVVGQLPVTDAACFAKFSQQNK